MMKKLYDEGDDTMKKVLTQVPVGSRNSVVYFPAFHTLFCIGFLLCGTTPDDCRGMDQEPRWRWEANPRVLVSFFLCRGRLHC